MLRKDNIPVKNWFNIWFNREERKEFYTTSIPLLRFFKTGDEFIETYQPIFNKVKPKLKNYNI